MSPSRTLTTALTTIALIAALLSSATAQDGPQRVTLYSGLKYRMDGSGRAEFNFKEALRGDHADWLKRTRDLYDISFGAVILNGENDWLSVFDGPNSRTRVKDLGEVEWSDLCCAQPLPTPPRGGNIRVPRNAETYEASSEQRITQALTGHMYVLHVKNKEADFYVMFRVEELERGDHCTISWKIMPSPE